REPDDVEVTQWARVLERHERQPARAELLLHVDPRHIAALAECARIVVQDLVEDLEPEMAHADVVDVGECGTHARVRCVPVLVHGAVFPAEVTGGFLHAVNELCVRMTVRYGCRPRFPRVRADSPKGTLRRGGYGHRGRYLARIRPARCLGAGACHRRPERDA